MVRIYQCLSVFISGLFSSLYPDNVARISGALNKESLLPNEGYPRPLKEAWFNHDVTVKTFKLSGCARATLIERKAFN